MIVHICQYNIHDYQHNEVNGSTFYLQKQTQARIPSSSILDEAAQGYKKQ